MCRFLMIKSPTPFQPKDILRSFARMAEKSRSFNGDWQGDGWGIGWLNGEQCWQLTKSLLPVWEDEDFFGTIPESRMFIVHARSASFPEHQKNLEYNQPFIKGRLAFVFNGFVRGVSLPYPVSGSLGSEKIWNILRNLLEESSPLDALSRIKCLLQNHSRRIQALNIGLSDGGKMYALCYFRNHPEYYKLYSHESHSLRLICSEPLEGFDFVPLLSDRRVAF